MARELSPPLLLWLLLAIGHRLAVGAALPRAVVHVGPHKTATLFIQTSVCRHAAHLQQHGWVLPLCAQCGQQQCSPKVFAHLAWQFHNDTLRWSCPVDAISCFREGLRGAREAGRHVLLTAEDLSTLAGERMQLFAQSLQGFNVSIVIYVRRALPMLLSRYYQLQEGFSKFQPESLGRYFLRTAVQQGGNGKDFFDGGFKGLITRWANAFGESALHLVSYEGVAAAGLDPFLVMLERVLRLPPVPNDGTRLNVRPPGRVVAATTFLIHYVHLRSDEPTWLAFPCARPIAEARLMPLLPLSCKPFTGWAAALNKRERAAAATTAPGAHRHCFDLEPEVSPLPEACEVEYPELFKRWGELGPKIREVAAAAVEACPAAAVMKPLWVVKQQQQQQGKV